DGDVELDLEFNEAPSRASGTVPWVLGAVADGLLLVPAGGKWLLVDALNGSAHGVAGAARPATHFSPPLAAGIARWALDTAVAYAKVREQFGKPIGSFQAIKHLCAEMLCRAEQVAVAAADAARAAGDEDDRQLSIAAAIAASIGIDAVKANVRDCIQVLGGIGITWEHDAHLYLRRAYGIGQFLGGPARWLRRTAELTQGG